MRKIFKFISESRGGSFLRGLRDLGQKSQYPPSSNFPSIPIDTPCPLRPISDRDIIVVVRFWAPRVKLKIVGGLPPLTCRGQNASILRHRTLLTLLFRAFPIAYETQAVRRRRNRIIRDQFDDALFGSAGSQSEERNFTPSMVTLATVALLPAML